MSACVSSILEQSIRDLRALIIDDASPDDTLVVARKLAEEGLRVGVISHSQNWGHIRTYNAGIAWASADYFMLLSADDLLVAGALERAISILDTHPDVVLTYGGSIKLEQGIRVPDVGEQCDYTWTRQDGLGVIEAYCSSGLNLLKHQLSSHGYVLRSRLAAIVHTYRTAGTWKCGSASPLMVRLHARSTVGCWFSTTFQTVPFPMACVNLPRHLA